MFTKEALHRPIDFAKAACDTLMNKFQPEDLPPKGQCHYHQGVFLMGMLKTWHICREQKYFDYLKAYVDSIMDANGVPYDYNPQSMDDLMPGCLMFDLYTETGDPKYKKCLDLFIRHMLDYPRNAQGGLYHKGHTTDQMWLDGLYMGGPLSVHYGVMFHQPALIDTSIFQALLMEKNTRDSKTGLLCHAFDYSRQAPWADKETGRSPEFWGRSIGWVPVALLDELELMPRDYFLRDEVERMVRDLLMALLPYQDPETGLWYQVVDKPQGEGNWLETSCSCLFSAALYKAVRMGLIDAGYEAAARKGYAGVIRRLKYNDQGIIIDGVCIGTGVGDYTHYINRPTSANDLHGAGAFILMCQEAEQGQDIEIF